MFSAGMENCIRSDFGSAEIITKRHPLIKKNATLGTDEVSKKI